MRQLQVWGATVFLLLTTSVIAGGEPDRSASADDVAVFDPSAKAKGLRKSTEGLYDVAPGMGFSLKFQHGPNSTYAVYRTEEGKGRQLPVRINRHSEETGYVVKGSILFRAGYNGGFTHVLRAGDSIVIPECSPHSGFFGWDNNEETILVSTFVEKYHEYGSDDTGGAPKEFADKIKYDSDSGVAESTRCHNMDGSPPVTWTIEDLRKWGEEHRNDPVSTEPGWLEVNPDS